MHTQSEVLSLIASCNEVIRNKPKPHGVKGQITSECQDFILKDSQTNNLQRWKLFFLSFLHNSGTPSNYKASSPFLSFTHGSRKMQIARKFALNRCKHDTGIIFLYSLNANFPYYFQAKYLTDQLAKYNVDWYQDIHHEVILVNGMYPHFLVGVFEVTKTRTPRFILNPWIYDEFRRGNEFNYTEGVSIDQSRFQALAGELGYQRYFYHEFGRQMEYLSMLGKNEGRQVFRV